MTVYAQTSRTLATITDVKEVYPYYYLASSSIDSGAAPHNNASPEISPDTTHNPGSRSVTVTYNGNSYIWTDVEPSLTINNNIINDTIGQLYVVECTIFSNNTYNWGPLMTSSTYAAAKAAYNNAIIAKNATDLLGGHFIYKGTNTVKQGVITTPSGAGVIQTINDDPANWGYNTWIGSNGIKLRKNEIDLSKWTDTGLTFYSPSTTSQGNRAMELTGSNLTFYASDGITPQAVFGGTGAQVRGAITATSLTIDSDGTTYDGMAAINISGYDIEITSDSTGVISPDTSVYLYPHLYHNGVEIEYLLSVDTEVDNSKTYYTRSGTAGNYTYTVVANPTGNPKANQYYEHIDYSNFVWYENDTEPGTAGDASNYGRYLAEYGNSYRVVYDFDDGAVNEGTQVQTRTIDPSKYITKISPTGITIHPETWTNQSSYIQLDGSGMELFNSNGDSIAQYGSSIRIGKSTGNHLEIDNNGVSILNNTNSLANFGSTARIGPNNSSRFLINNNSLQAYDNNNNKYFEVNSNGLSWGSNTAATVADLANKPDFSDVEDAAKTATNYLIDINSQQGVVIKSIMGSYNTGSETDNYIQINSDKVSFYKTGIEKVRLTSENLIIGDSLNYIDVNANGMQIYKNNINVANFGDSIRIGREETGYTRIYLDPTSRSDGKINAWRILSPNDSVVQSVAFDGEAVANQSIVKDYDENIYQVGNQGSKTNLLTTSVNSKTVSISVGELIDSVNDTNVSLILTSKAYSDWQEYFYLPGDSYHWTFTNHSFNFVKGVSSSQTENFIEAKDDLDLGTEGITRTITVNYDGNNTFTITSTAQKTLSSDESNYYIVNTFISSASFTKSGVLVPFNEFSGYTRMNSTGVGTTFIGLDVDKNANISTLASTGEDKDLFNIIHKLNLYNKIIAGNITIEPKRTRIGAGNRSFPSPATLVATTVPEGLDVTWSSNDEDYITVTQNGVITAHGTFSPIDPVIVTASTVFQGITYTATCEVFVENIG